MDEHQTAELARLWKEGVPAPEIARRVGATRPAVLKWARRHGLPSQGRYEGRVDIPTLYRLWADHSLGKAEVASALQVTPQHLARLASQHKLPWRPREHKSSTVDPTPLEIEQRAAECRARHFAQRRAEPWEAA
jgi:hypothetical protein